jgi:hypothetical protein
VKTADVHAAAVTTMRERSTGVSPPPPFAAALRDTVPAVDTAAVLTLSEMYRVPELPG